MPRNASSKPLVILAAGGTGGHVFPAESLARELQKRGYRLAFFTDKRGGQYSGLLGELETIRVSAGSVAGRGLLGKIRSVISLLFGTLQAFYHIGKMRPNCVVGFGGYPSVPTMLAASLKGCPSLIHEQNAVLGRANRLLSAKVKRICTSFKKVDAIEGVPSNHIVFTGMPVRPAILDKRNTPYQPIETDGDIRVLIMGGSQGAQVFSDVLPVAFAKLPDDLKKRLRITQQCREEFLEDTRRAYKAEDIQANCQTFFQDVPEQLATCHLLIARSGASTVAEATVIGRPSLLVPYPYATDNHQMRNAHSLDEAGGSWLIPQDHLNADMLCERLTQLFSHPDILTQTAAASFKVGRPDAALHLANCVEEIIEVTY